MTADPPIDQECVEAYVYVRAPLRLLVLQRPPDRGSIWVPVSGKVEPTDPDLRSALLRELREETGFGPPAELADLEWAVPFEGPNGGRWRLHAFSARLTEPTPPRLSDEHVAHAWLPIGDARARLHYEDNRAAVDRLTEREARSAGGGERV